MTHQITWRRTGKEQLVNIIKCEGGYYYYKMEGTDVVYKAMRREWDTIKPLGEEPAENLPHVKGLF